MKGVDSDAVYEAVGGDVAEAVEVRDHDEGGDAAALLVPLRLVLAVLLVVCETLREFVDVEVTLLVAVEAAGIVTVGVTVVVLDGTADADAVVERDGDESTVGLGVNAELTLLLIV